MSVERGMRRIIILAALISGFSTSPIFSGPMGNAIVHSIDSGEFSPPAIPEQVSFDINIVFLGIDESRIEDDLASRLPRWYAPIVQNTYVLKNREIVYDMNFTITYHVSFLDETQAREYRGFLHESSAEGRSPWFIQPEHPTARYVPSSLAEGYLAENVVDSPYPTLVIIDTYSFDPGGHTPYYYNASYNELEAEFGGYASNSVPWASTYQIAGGGRDNRLIWLDLSAGPTEYEAYGSSGTGGKLEIVGVSESTIPPVWSYEGAADAEGELTEDIVLYITKAVELRLLRAYTFTPAHAHKEIRFEMLMVDLDPSDFDFMAQINGDYMVSEFERLNPFVDWTYSISDWDWESDSGFAAALDRSRNDDAGTYDALSILAYLDGRYASIFNSSSRERLVIPVFLFGMPEDYRFTPDWGANTWAIVDQFVYIISKQSRSLADPEHVETMEISLDDLSVPKGGYFNLTNEGGRLNEDVQISVDVRNGSLNVYIMDEYNYERYKQSLPFEDMLGGSMGGLSDSSGIGTATIYTGILGRYSVVFEDIGGSGATFDLDITVKEDRSIGYTWKTMHEIWHAIGLDHPFEGFSWGNYDHPSSAFGRYTYRLWDMSYTQTSYSHEAPTISVLDIDTLMRGFIPRYWEDARSAMEGIIEAQNDGDYPAEVDDHVTNASEHFQHSIAQYGTNDDPDHYLKSLEAIFEALTELEAASAALGVGNGVPRGGFDFSNLLVPGFAAILLGVILVFMFRRRIQT